MVDQFAFGREFFALLEQEDERIARCVADEGCPHCEGPLYRGDYDRKPRGGLLAEGAETSIVRFSLCCGREGCRRRATPPSLRFLGRRVYVGAVVIMACVLARVHKAAAVLRRMTGVPERTVRRWLSWWQGAFVSTEVFIAVRARLIGVAVDALPTSILDGLAGTAEQRVQTMLVLLAPLTTGTVADGSRFTRSRK